MGGQETLAAPSGELAINDRLDKAVAAQAEVLDWNEYVAGLDFEELMTIYPVAHRMRRDQLGRHPSLSKRESAIMTVETSIRRRIVDFIAKDGEERQVLILNLRGNGYADYAFDKMLEIQHRIDAEDGIA